MMSTQPDVQHVGKIHFLGFRSMSQVEDAGNLARSLVVHGHSSNLVIALLRVSSPTHYHAQVDFDIDFI